MSNAQETFNALKQDRETYVTRAEECAKLTIPFLFPKESDDGGTKYDTPYQAVGARGVNNLASKLLLALFPPNAKFFKLDVRKDVMEYLTSQGGEKQQIEQQLVQQEQVFQKYFESHQFRVTLHEAIKQLVVAGNCLLFLPPKEGGIKLYKLNSYVVQRDTIGNVIQIVTCDKLSRDTLPLDVARQLKEVPQESNSTQVETVEVYTHLTYSNEDDRFYSYQEIDGVELAGYEQTYPADACPYIPLRLFKLDGESYSRSYVEEYIGDLKSLEALSKAIVEMSAIAATAKYLVNPNGVTRPLKLQQTINGGYCAGRAEDITCLQLDKAQDLQITKATADAIEQRLSYAFMLNSAVQRNAERVTAEEIRYVANELEDTLGGIYSILSQELQLPLAKILMNTLAREGEMANMPDNVVQPAIITGVEAIGRGHDLSKLTQFMSLISQNPEAASVVKWENVCQMIANACDLDTTGLIKTPEEVQQEQQEAMMMQTAQAVLPNATKGVMDGLNQQQQQGGE